MISCGCWNGYCPIHGGFSTVTIDSSYNSSGYLSSTGNATGNSTETYGNRRPSRSALELERDLQKFEKLAKWKPPRPIVKVDEKRLIAKPARAHAKPHQASSSRAAMSVRQFAQRVK